MPRINSVPKKIGRKKVSIQTKPIVSVVSELNELDNGEDEVENEVENEVDNEMENGDGDGEDAEENELDGDDGDGVDVDVDDNEDGEDEIPIEFDDENEEPEPEPEPKEPVKLKSKPKIKTAVKKPKITAKKTKSKKPSSDNEQDSTSIDEAELDRVLLQSVKDEDDDVPKKIIGSKAKLKSMMGNDESEEADDSNKPAKSTKKTRTKKATTKTGDKKGPGRPRKTPKKEPIPRKGISKNPTNADDFIEVLYDNPPVLKKIFQFFKALAASHIQIIFRPKHIIFYTEDHHETSKIKITVDCSKLNHYYCKSELSIGISARDMELIMNKVDKEYNSIILLSTVGSTQRNITLILENDMEIDEIHTIDVIAAGQYKKMENEVEFTDEDYMIKFELPSRYFRKTINDIKTMSGTLSIVQEDSESPLVFEYMTTNKKIQSKHPVKKPEKIKLQSNLSNDDSFRVDVSISYLKPISASQIADDIQIFVDENKNFMTKSYIDDGTIEIKTLTQIIDERPEEEE